jgi:4-hydroxy-tetrahydrodipicolinate synthase
VQVVLDPELLVSLAEEGTIAGVKDSSGDQQRARTLAEVSSGLPEFRRYTGSEHCMDACLLWGFHAVVPGLANPLSRFHVRLTDAASEGDWPGAAQLQGQIVRLLELYAYALPEASYTASAIAAMKEALVQQGVIAHATASRPFAPADEGLRDHVARILKWARVLDGQ